MQVDSLRLRMPEKVPDTVPFPRTQVRDSASLPQKGTQPRPDAFFVLSTILYVLRFCVVGGRGSPFTLVTSRPFPPRGPIS